MLVFDIPTIASLAVVGSLVFSACSFGAWRHMPEEPCLRDWGIGLAFLFLGALELFLRTPASAAWTIPLGNGLFAIGDSWKLMALRRLMRLPRRHDERWLPLAAFALVAVPCWWYTDIQPSLNARLIWVSLVMGIWYVAYAWTLAQHHDRQLAGWLRLTIAIQLGGLALFLARAWVAPTALVSPDYSKTSSLLIAAPGYYGLLFNIWMSLTMILVITSRMHDRVVETLGFNREILANSPLATAVYRADGQCALVNDAYAQLVETPRAELLQQNFHHLAHWRDAGLFAACTQALNSRQSGRCEFHTTTPSGHQIWLDCRIHPSSILGTTHLLLQFNDLTERKRLEDQLRQMAFHDPLTMLPNRRLLMDRILQAQHGSERQSNHAALLFIDLDKFKQLNDCHGHGIGDKLLVALAQSLSQAVRKSDTVARLGGDEFVVMLENLGASVEQALSHAQDMATVIHQAINRDYRLDGVDYRASASIGIRVFNGTRETPEALLQDADSAMYQSKLNMSMPRFF
ncbi:PAS domain S-box-containing protein/diguanylate cyclase (GGDEF)-like protein [Paludibacterium purpuratum]|uniref:PAS domain S-box-containing protein/diguanylate cyclase (GGDEF)-like protein n=1 Tax=Paludibacterium purpuratum TaxID=1144873 RepID=A0A4R7B7D9_9NEIS|nr:PAS domain S-box-containing protein/diguanylate cyclase (GGDEF)-like protein [Paludibacterium purpuratum]